VQRLALCLFSLGPPPLLAGEGLEEGRLRVYGKQCEMVLFVLPQERFLPSERPVQPPAECTAPGRLTTLYPQPTAPLFLWTRLSFAA
jgi:hypothetical protein